jgi:uncharacterized protein (TIGR03032 family)
MNKPELKNKVADEAIEFRYQTNLPEFLKRIGATIFISTYQASKLIMVGQEKGKMDIRFIEYPRPMGMYAKNGNIWAGLGHCIYQFGNFNAAISKIDDGNDYDACYLPTNIHITGDIDIHEMEYIEDELYFINTKFSCLCIKKLGDNFIPIWKPPFISTLQPVDKCHLNGFCSRDGKPRYVTMLGESDEPLGWRSNKINGGILMDITTNEVLVRGLSMPHSPRWHQDKLWVLESGKGALSYYDFQTKALVEVVSVPGFTRGLDMVGDLAFIGISKVRDSAVFSGLPITKLEKRVSGVFVVDIKQGTIVTSIEFTSGVDEVFSVAALPHSKMAIFDFDSDYSKNNYMVSNHEDAQVMMPESEIEVASTYFEKGMDLFNENKKEEAIEEFKKALEMQSDYLPATTNIAIALGDLGRFDEALAMLQETIDKDASMIEAYDSMGYVYYKQGKFDQARAQYQKVLEIDPKNEKQKVH